MLRTDIKNIKQIFEADPFKSVSDDDLKSRQTAEQIAKLALVKKQQKELGREDDICPHCAADLRAVGVRQDETSWGSVNRFHSGGQWDWGSGKVYDSETGDSYCNECDGTVEQGVDWDVED